MEFRQMDAFTNGYFKLLCRKLAGHGYDSDRLVRAVWKGTGAMVKNDGACSNEAAFWRCFSDIYGEDALKDIHLFNAFYANEFQQSKAFCGYNSKAREAVALSKSLGLRVALATNPLFPAVATESRIRWAGLEPGDFELYTTYENIGYCKPNPAYYAEILRRMGLEGSECLMVGNDVGEDMVAETLGMKVFLLTDCLINKNNEDITRWPHGGFDDLMEFVKNEAAPC